MYKVVFRRKHLNETTQIVIGTDNYIPLCRACYDDKQSNSSNKSYLPELSNV